MTASTADYYGIYARLSSSTGMTRIPAVWPLLLSTPPE